ncbi:MAG: aminotransferase class V-fold PLP-dependent enzyme [Myxococcales bacterium]|nr:aminotransferase class V-fold PLP-dependent enzyme [Myxococcales bacterium]
MPKRKSSQSAQHRVKRPVLGPFVEEVPRRRPRKIMVRSGTHCAHPYFEAQAVAGSVRFSPYVYSGETDMREALEAMEFILGR